MIVIFALNKVILTLITLKFQNLSSISILQKENLILASLKLYEDK